MAASDFLLVFLFLYLYSQLRKVWLSLCTKCYWWVQTLHTVTLTIFILIFFNSLNNILIHFNHIESSLSICNENKLTAFYMIRVLTKRYSQKDCSILLKILYLAPGSSKEFFTNMGFFIQSQICHLQLSVILFRCVAFFAVFHSPHKVLIPETILTRRLITKTKTICSQITLCESFGVFIRFLYKLY